MIQRDYLERILKMNGSSPTAPDEEIRSILISARWHKDDVESAMTVLRENVNTHKGRVEEVHNVFTTDKRLSPEAIKGLLGIDVEVSASELQSLRVRETYLYWLQIISIFVLAVLIAVGSLVGFMYTQKIGIFHPAEASTFLNR